VTDNINTSSDNSNAKNSHEDISKMAKIKAKAEKLSGKETREILTPFAFKIDKSLFGISLAVPWQRAMALSVDLVLVALLSGAPGELLAVLVAITLFNIGSKKRAKKSGKISGLKETALRIFAALIVFVILIDFLPKFFTHVDTFNNRVEQAGQNQDSVSGNKSSQSNKQGTTEKDNNDFIKATLTLAASVAISHSECEQYSCWQELSEGLSSAYAEQTTSSAGMKKFNTYLIDNIASNSHLTPKKMTQLSGHLQKLHENNESQQQTATPKIDENNMPTIAEKAKGISENIETKIDNLTALNEKDKGEPADVELPNPAVYKGFAWLQGLVEDLGLGFGWAAFYFTMFTALWYGQTPGKRLFNIRVVQLDGTPLSIWDSFGRYGGYGAGIATGLLGFAQIYWDPNRQAIQDKISSTIVVDDKGFDRKTNKKKVNKPANGPT
tara:strand:+ start:11620 stop:12939 length:1320 start_codon:yes stop_codon:yes gene_type:complete